MYIPDSFIYLCGPTVRKFFSHSNNRTNSPWDQIKQTLIKISKFIWFKYILWSQDIFFRSSISIDIKCQMAFSCTDFVTPSPVTKALITSGKMFSSADIKYPDWVFFSDFFLQYRTLRSNFFLINFCQFWINANCLIIWRKCSMLPMGMYFPFQNNQVTLLHQQVHRYNFFQNNIFLEVKFFFHCGTLNAA